MTGEGRISLSSRTYSNERKVLIGDDLSRYIYPPGGERRRYKAAVLFSPFEETNAQCSIECAPISGASFECL